MIHVTSYTYIYGIFTRRAFGRLVIRNRALFLYLSHDRRAASFYYSLKRNFLSILRMSHKYLSMTWSCPQKASSRCAQLFRFNRDIFSVRSTSSRKRNCCTAPPRRSQTITALQNAATIDYITVRTTLFTCHLHFVIFVINYLSFANDRLFINDPRESRVREKPRTCRDRESAIATPRLR